MLMKRRRFLQSSLAMPVIGLWAKADAVPQGDAQRKLKVVVTGGHPGDPEYGCGGTIARYTDLGHDVTLLYLNRGEKGCPGKSAEQCSAIRVAEANKACGILKTHAVFAPQIDGDATLSTARYDEFRDLIAAEKADVLFTHWPIDAHRDHRAISLLTFDAWLRLGKKAAFYYYEVSDGEDTQMIRPTDYVDISATEARKREACFAHASQTPDRYYELQQRVTRFRGVESGHAEAEAYVRHVLGPGGLLP
jgi:N-acetylglucosamine malate deacetylase 1